MWSWPWRADNRSTSAGITGVHARGGTRESRQLALFPLLSKAPQRYNAKRLPAPGRILNRSDVQPTCHVGSDCGVVWDKCPPVQGVVTGTGPI
jgi:hypothetical protein